MSQTEFNWLQNINEFLEYFNLIMSVHNTIFDNRSNIVKLIITIIIYNINRIILISSEHLFSAIFIKILYSF